MCQQGLVPVVVTIACLLVDLNVDFLTAQEPSLPLTPSVYERTFSYVNADESLTNLERQYISLFDNESHQVISLLHLLS